MGYQIAGTSVPANSKTWIELPTTSDAENSRFDVPAIVVNGGEGPTIWFQAAVHGDEHTGSIALRDTMQAIDPAEVTGRLVGIPVVNRSAFAGKSRTAPVDNKDLNRQFPGRDNGTFSELLAKEMYEYASEHADYFVDLHSGRTDTYIAGYSIFPAAGGDVETTGKKLASATDLPYAVGMHPDTIDGLLMFELAEEGIPGMIVETGGEGRLHKTHVDDASQAIRGIAAELDVLPEPAPRSPDVQLTYGMDFLKAGTGGYFECDVDSNDQVTEGEVLAEITGIRGEIKEQIRAPYDGLVVSVRTFGVARPGDPLFEVVPEPDS